MREMRDESEKSAQYRMKTFTDEKLLQRSMDVKMFKRNGGAYRNIAMNEVRGKASSRCLVLFRCDNMAHQTHDVLTPTL